MLRAAGSVIVSPREAFAGPLDEFFSSAGAVPAVIGLFLFAVAVDAAPQLIRLSAGPGQSGDAPGSLPAQLLTVIGFGVLNVLIAAALIAGYNRITGGSDEFLTDFGSLALSFAFITATIVLVTAPLAVPLALSGELRPGGTAYVVFWIRNVWIWALEVFLVMAVTDLQTLAAMALLFGAGLVAGVVTALIIVLFLHAEDQSAQPGSRRPLPIGARVVTISGRSVPGGWDGLGHARPQPPVCDHG